MLGSQTGRNRREGNVEKGEKGRDKRILKDVKAQLHFCQLFVAVAQIYRPHIAPSECFE